jgi:hypothetical protein
MLQFIRKTLMRKALLLFLVLASRIVEVDVTLAAATNMVILIRGVAHCQLRDHFGVVGHFGGWADAGGSDVAEAAATSGVCAITLVTVYALANDLAVNVLRRIMADVALASAAVGDHWLLLFTHTER